MDDHKLYVITCVINPSRYASRYKLYNHFAKMVQDAGAELYTVEVAFGHRPHEVTESGNPKHIQLRTWTELWHKENAINVGFGRLPVNWKYAAWVDADISFMRPDWVSETLHQLQHYCIVQMFDIAYDLTPQYTPYQQHNGFVYSYYKNFAYPHKYETWHPGFAWAIRKHSFNSLGGLIDWAILGAGDRHMALGLIGKIDSNPQLTDNYKIMNLEWQKRCDEHIKKNVGFVPGGILHHWHGKKANRKYKERWKILVDNQYDPMYDLKRDSQGLWQLTDRNLKLRDELRLYFRQRNEDSIDL